MIRKSAKSFVASLVVASVGFSAFTLPAAAGGSLSVSIVPGNAKEQKAMKAGLGVYALVNGIKNGSIRQYGHGNAAGLAQNGGGNLGIVHQHGNGHDGSIQQNGNNNAYGLFQFGRNTSGHVAQNGSGNAGATFQFGW